MADPVIVAQIGARRRYAVPDALHAAGLLGHFYTDAVCPTPVARMINSIPSGWVPQQPQTHPTQSRSPNTHTYTRWKDLPDTLRQNPNRRITPRSVSEFCQSCFTKTPGHALRFLHV